MRPKKHDHAPEIDPEDLARDLHSPDEAVRARAVRALCPCRMGIDAFQRHWDTLTDLKKDPSPAVRAAALHVFEDAGEMENEGYPTHPRETTDEMLRRRRASRFLPDDMADGHRRTTRQTRKGGNRTRDRF